MRPKSWTPKLRRSSPYATGRLSISLLLWFLVGLLLPWLLKSVELHRSDAKQLSFEEALEKSTELNEQPSNPSPSATKLSSEQIYQQAKPFVVEVWISTTGIIAPAAGILLTSDGLVLTNYHVIHEASFDFVRSPNGQDFNGTVIEVDPSLDLALIQLEGARNLPTANLSSRSAQIKIGDTVYAIGSPLAAHWKMTEAEVIEVNSDCGLPSLQCIRTPKGFLKPGNSGGPLLDSTGQVVGVNRAIQDGTGEGVSIPIETIQQFVDRTQNVPN